MSLLCLYSCIGFHSVLRTASLPIHPLKDIKVASLLASVNRVGVNRVGMNEVGVSGGRCEQGRCEQSGCEQGGYIQGGCEQGECGQGDSEHDKHPWSSM